MTVIISNTSCNNNPSPTPACPAQPNTIFNTGAIKIAVDEAIADAGATGHFMVPGAPVLDVRPATKPLIIHLPDGETIKSTHTCKLNLPWLPEAATAAHIVPGLAHTSLISIRVLCDAGCEVIYNGNHCLVYYNKKLVWKGIREATTKLWVLPVAPTNKPQHLPMTLPAKEATEYAANAYQMTSKRALIKYLHQCLFCPPKTTLLKAIRNNQLTTWPGLTAAAVEKYLPDHSPATDKGHMRRQRKGIRSTQTKVETELERIETERDYHPPGEQEKFNQIFCYAGVIDKKDGTIYVDNTGNFPITSIDGMRAVFILYDWTSNAILATPIATTTDEKMIAAFKDNITYLSKRGFKPSFNIIDNVASKAIKTYLENEKIKMQAVEPNNHRVNAAERAIQTFKNHFIAGLSIGDKDFPTILWCKLIKQAQDSLNILRTSRVHPKVSAFHVLEGTHDFNRHPWAPPATRATIFNPPETRTSWGSRALDAWYIGPAWDHYRCLQFQIPSTGGIRTSGQYQLYPQHCELPIETPMDAATRVAKDLLEAVRRVQGLEERNPGRHTQALETLAKIFRGTTEHLPAETAHRQQTSTNPTEPSAIRHTPRVHTRVTRSNTPGIITQPGPPISEGGQRPTTEGASHEPAVPRDNETNNQPPRRSARLHPHGSPTNPRIISQEEVIAVAMGVMETTPASSIPSNRRTTTPASPVFDHEHFCAPVIHPSTGKMITKYTELANDPETTEVWKTAFGKEWAV